MVFGAVSYQGKLPLYFLPDGQNLNSELYVNSILADVVIPSARKLYPGGFCYQQDGATCHTSRMTVDYLDQQNIDFIRPKEWPPSSPDANPLDYRIWSFMSAEVYKQGVIRDVKELKLRILQAWEKLSMANIQSAIDQFYPRLRTIVTENGGQIEHKFR